MFLFRCKKHRYAVKCNPDPVLMGAMWSNGLESFDCASLSECELVRSLFPSAVINFMHPVKSARAIREAYHRLGVKTFVLDCEEELELIIDETDRRDPLLTLIVRIQVAFSDAKMPLKDKFGAAAHDGEAARVLAACRAALVSGRVGISFHVGSQCEDPRAWREAMVLAARVAAEARVKIDICDVGGGFPVVYPHCPSPPSLLEIFAEISRGREDMMRVMGGDLQPEAPALWCEPGRALVAGSAVEVVRVMRVRGSAVFINDGTYGNLSDAGDHFKWLFPTTILGKADRGAIHDHEADPFEASFYGPTCDSSDFMKGPFVLPRRPRTGDLVQFGMFGAYTSSLASTFNGFGLGATVKAIIIEC